MEILTIVAIVVGPILAVQAQKWIERLTQKRQAKEAIFKTLMSTRGTRLSLAHVQALNMIDLEFHGERKKDKRVVDAWRIYLDQLNDCPRNTTDPDYKTKLDAWSAKSIEDFNDMLFEMATALGYDFDRVILKRGSYTPTGYGETEAQQWIVQRGITELFLGLKSIPIHIVEPPQTKETEPSQKKSSMPLEKGTSQENSATNSHR